MTTRTKKRKVDVTAYLVVPEDVSPGEFTVIKLEIEKGIEAGTRYRVRNGGCTCPGCSYRDGEYQCRHVRMVYNRSKVVTEEEAVEATRSGLRWILHLRDGDGRQLFDRVLFEDYKKIRGNIIGVRVTAHGKPLKIGDQTESQFKVISSGVEIDVKIENRGGTRGELVV